VSVVKISFIIPLYNELELTKICLKSLEETVGRSDIEVILVDDSSTDGTTDYLATLKEPYRVILNQERAGYAANNNKAALVAKGEVLALLNNDLVLTEGWLAPMLACLEKHKQCGLVGNIQLNPKTGLINHAGMFFDLEGCPVTARKNRKCFPAEDYSEWNAVTAACVLIRRDVYMEMNGFDEAYINGSEDIDLCIRLRLAAYQNYVANKSRIFHHVSSSPERHRYNDKNTQLLKQKWAVVASKWGKDEWPLEYLRRYARQWWRFNITKLIKALYLLLLQSNFSANKEK